MQYSPDGTKFYDEDDQLLLALLVLSRKIKFDDLTLEDKLVLKGIFCPSIYSDPKYPCPMPQLPDLEEVQTLVAEIVFNRISRSG